MDDPIREGDYVVLMRSFDSGNMKIIPVLKDTTVHYGKLHFNPTPLIGAKFSSVFEINNETMTKVDNFEEFDTELSDLVTSKITTFHEKSQFSQEKMIKRKKKKSHSNVVTVMKPTLALVIEMLFTREKIGGMREDIIGQILTLSNIQAGTRCLVMDHNQGVMTSAVISRLLPNGVCIQLLPDTEALQTTRRTMNMLNIREENCREHLFALTVKDLHKILKGTDSFEVENRILERRDADYQEKLDKAILDASEIHNRSNECSGNAQSENSKQEFKQILIKKAANRRSRNEERIGAASNLKESPLDSLILVVQHDHPLHLLKVTYPFLIPSGRFVIYSDTVSPLLECFQYLKTNGLAVSLSLSESWLRKYQVLPDRTRPEMGTSGYGGYLLSGTKALLGLEVDCDLPDQAMLR